MKSCEFIIKLLTIMNKHPDIVYWESNGQSLTFADLQNLEKEILPLYFKQSNHLSFFRQMNMYGFTRVRHLKDSQTFQHKTFKQGNEPNFHEIGRTNKSRVLKKAKESFSCQRKNFIAQVEHLDEGSQNCQNLLLDLLLYKDQIQKNIREIKGFLSQLAEELSDCRSIAVKQRIESIKIQDIADIARCERQAKEIDELIQSYKPERVKDPKINEQPHECSFELDAHSQEDRSDHYRNCQQTKDMRKHSQLLHQFQS